MKKIKTLSLSIIFIFAFSTISIHSAAQNFQWAKNFGSTNWDEAGSIALDGNSNLYNAGYFQGTVDFDPGPAVFTITALGMQDVFISKWDAAGNFIWVKTLASAGWEHCHAITTDKKGNIYLTGFFLGTTDFDPSTSVATLTSSSGGDGFICKLDQGGNFVWAKQIKGNLPVTIYDITIDKKGSILTTGFFDGKADMDPGPGTYTLQAVAYSDMFVNKLDSSGNFVWVKQISGLDGEVGHSICTDANGNIFTTGTFMGTADFNPGSATFTLQSPQWNPENFISKLDSSGNFVWAKKMGGENGLAIIADGVGNVYQTGMNFGNDIIINKLSPSGNIIWAKQIGGAVGYALMLDKNNNIYNTGVFFGTKDFDPGSGTFTLNAASTDSYIEKLDASGNFIWVKQFKSNMEFQARESAIDVNENIYMTGFFNGTADFDPSSSTYSLSSTGHYDNFIMKLSAPTTVDIEWNNFAPASKVYPNPTNGLFVVEFTKEYNDLNFVIQNLQGQEIEAKFFREGTRVVIQMNETNGVYILNILDSTGFKHSLKFIRN